MARPVHPAAEVWDLALRLQWQRRAPQPAAQRDDWLRLLYPEFVAAADRDAIAAAALDAALGLTGADFGNVQLRDAGGALRIVAHHGFSRSFLEFFDCETPLIAPSGRVLGMLSTHYQRPRQPSARDLHLIDIIAQRAARWLERKERAIA